LPEASHMTLVLKNN